MKRRFLFLLFLLQSVTLFSQNYPTAFFRMPVDTVVRLSGNFCEIRYDHFHYGWDIKTGGKEGLKIVAAGDGYVSRIKAGPNGYGKALYITHPNGYVTVYAHLSAFNTAIGNYVTTEQYKKESYEIELFPPKDSLKVKKGELIALSGNTGFSEAPHLHFEIRDEKTEEIINPYFFGLKIADNVKPFFKTLAIYPQSDGGIINGNNEPYYIDLIKKNGVYQYKLKDSVVVTGNIGFGIEVFDTENNNGGQNQIYSLELQIDGKKIYAYEMTRFAFDQTRYVNAHIDYYAQRVLKKTLQKAFLLPGNKFPIYRDVMNNGIVNFTGDSTHTGKFIAKDYYGNTSEFVFVIKVKKKQKPIMLKSSTYPDESFEELKCDGGILISVIPNDEFAYSDSNYYKIKIPANSFYEMYKYAICTYYDGSKITTHKDKINSTLSYSYKIHGKYIPIHNSYSLSLKTDSLPDSLINKLLIVSIDDKGNFSSKGGQYDSGWITTKVWSFGTFAVAIDTTAPVIKQPKLPKGNIITTQKKLEFKISDNLSGIKTYRVELDGKWLLFEYEPKAQSLFCLNNADLPKGKHTLKVTVTDNKGNTAVKWFTYNKQ